MSNKIIQVADCIHETIQISKFEKAIISTQAFNRLHNTNQNSTVYLTYPSNQNKRFSHSLGSMHLAGRMFYHSIVNASEQIRQNFLEDAHEQISNLINNNQEMLREILDQFQSIAEDYKSINPAIFKDVFYTCHIPNIIDKNKLFTYTVVLQSVRCAALLHDVGHPPFSHIVERTLTKLFDVINSIPETEKKERQLEFIRIVSLYIDKTDKIDLHEQIGTRIADRLLQHVARRFIPNIGSIEDAQARLFFFMVHKFTKGILEDENKFFEDIHRLIDSPFDCDRLDYVVRDIVNSGFAQGRLPYDRLISSMRIVQKEDRFLFCPDVRSLSAIEDLYHLRWFLYKHITGHHRVVKTDFLLDRVIFQLAQNWMQEDEKEPLAEEGKKDPSTGTKKNDASSQQVLPADISGLWMAVKNVFSDDHYFNALIQWDDGWLFAVLRNQYYRYYRLSNEIIKDQLEEVLSGKKYYYSVVKRMNDFLAIDEAALGTFVSNRDKWDEQLAKYPEHQKKLLEHVDKYNEDPDNWRRSVTEKGFFLAALISLMSSGKKDVEKQIEQEVEGGILDLTRSKYGFKDCITAFKKLKTGLEESPPVSSNGEVVYLVDISQIGLSLERSRSLFPVFFVYVSGKELFDRKQLQQDIGVKTAECLMRLLLVN